MPIEDIEVGDYVWAENPETGQIELKEVLNTFEKQVDTIVTITIDGEKIQTTEAHLFYVEGTGWIPASMLQEGDTLSLEDGREVPIQSIKIVDYNYYIHIFSFSILQTSIKVLFSHKLNLLYHKRKLSKNFLL